MARARSTSQQSGTERVGVLAVAVGGAVGATIRLGAARTWPTAAGSFPATTLVVNLAGCFALGLVLTVLLERWSPSPYARAFLCIGLLGALTTFSTFALETVRLVDHDEPVVAAVYVAASVVGALALTALGAALARAVPPRSHEPRR